MPIHSEPHPLHGQTVMLLSGTFAGSPFVVEDWWDRIAGQSWKVGIGNPACLDYAFRSVAADRDPALSDDVVYGKIDGLGRIIHVQHLPEVAPAEAA